MAAQPRGYRRKNSMRHPTYDYTLAGAYFVTICVRNGRCVFGQIADAHIALTPLGHIAVACWLDFAARHPEVKIDQFVVMPNHDHVLLWLRQDLDLASSTEAAPERAFGHTTAGSLSTLIGAYKGSVTHRAGNRGMLTTQPLWQRDFWDRIVATEDALHRIRQYIQNNPIHWIDDKLHPDAPPNQYNQAWNSDKP